MESDAIRDFERESEEELVESTFVSLEYDPPAETREAWDDRLRAICDVWPLLSTPYDFLKLAHFLEGDESVVAEELHDAALRTAWRLRRPDSDPWDDEWWHEAASAVADPKRRDALLRIAAGHSGVE